MATRSGEVGKRLGHERGAEARLLSESARHVFEEGHSIGGDEDIVELCRARSRSAASG